MNLNTLDQITKGSIPLGLLVLPVDSDHVVVLKNNLDTICSPHNIFDVVVSTVIAG